VFRHFFLRAPVHQTQKVEQLIAQRTTVDLKKVQLPRRCLWLCAWSCTFVCRMCHLHGAFSSSAVRSSRRISALSVVVCDYARVYLRLYKIVLFCRSHRFDVDRATVNRRLTYLRWRKEVGFA